MSQQLFEDGKVINVDGVDLECVGVSYQESEGERHTFGYTFRPKSEVEADRAEAARVEEARIAAEQSAKAEEERIAAESEPSAPVVEQPVTQPEVIKEETLDVK